MPRGSTPHTLTKTKTMSKIPLIYPQGYYVKGYDIIGKHGRPLRPDKRNVYTLQTEGKPIHANLYKIVWSARHKVDIRKIPKEYSFRLTDTGILVVESFSDRMSKAKKIQYSTVTVQYEDYDYIERFAHLAKAMIQGEVDAKTQLFVLLNSKRDDLIQYARNASGGVSLQKATDYTDSAIIKVYGTILARTYAVPSPIASIKWHINNLIRQNRKKRL